jgi:hypothetical protein
MTPSERTGPDEKATRLTDPDVARWYRNLANGSRITADNYLRSLYNFSRRTGLSPAEVAGLSEQKAYEVLLDFVAAEQERKVAGSAILTYVKAA